MRYRISCEAQSWIHQRDFLAPTALLYHCFAPPLIITVFIRTQEVSVVLRLWCWFASFDQRWNLPMGDSFLRDTELGDSPVLTLCAHTSPLVQTGSGWFIWISLMQMLKHHIGCWCIQHPCLAFILWNSPKIIFTLHALPIHPCLLAAILYCFPILYLAIFPFHNFTQYSKKLGSRKLQILRVWKPYILIGQHLYAGEFQGLEAWGFEMAKLRFSASHYPGCQYMQSVCKGDVWKCEF